MDKYKKGDVVKARITAIEKYGAFKGTWLGIKRLVRCNPFSKGGYDPLK